MRTQFILIISLIGFAGFAQQDAQYTQYMYNTTVINPGYAGSRGAMSIFGLYRNQWVGLDGAPVSSTFSLNTPINDSKFGVGVCFMNDQIGPTVDNSISIDVSYYIQTSETYRLSFGLKGTGNFFNLDTSKLNPADQGDPQFQNINNFSPNFGVGLYLHSDKTYFGLSIPNFLETNNYDDNEVAIYKEVINYYFIAGTVFDLSDSVKFKPTLLTKLVTGAPLQVDLSANFMFNDKFVLGAAYRWDAAVSFMAGFQATDSLFLGYGYDLDTTSLNNYNYGSHEIFLRFEIFNNFNNITSPRFF